MRLTKTAKEAIKRNTRAKNRLALAFDKSGFTIERWIDENEENGNLTKATAINIISEELKLEDSEILEGVAA